MIKIHIFNNFKSYGAAGAPKKKVVHFKAHYYYYYYIKTRSEFFPFRNPQIYFIFLVVEKKWAKKIM